MPPTPFVPPDWEYPLRTASTPTHARVKFLMRGRYGPALFQVELDVPTNRFVLRLASSSAPRAIPLRPHPLRAGRPVPWRPAIQALHVPPRPRFLLKVDRRTIQTADMCAGKGHDCPLVRRYPMLYNPDERQGGLELLRTGDVATG